MAVPHPGRIEIHLGVVPDGDRRTSAAYLWVEDADALAEYGDPPVWMFIGPRTPSGASTRAPLSIPMAT